MSASNDAAIAIGHQCRNVVMSALGGAAKYASVVKSAQVCDRK